MDKQYNPILHRHGGKEEKVDTPNPSFDFRLSEEKCEAIRPLRRLTVHAHGLLQPSHMEWTQDGRLLCSEFGHGRVVDVTEGGNMRGAKPFAWNLRHPAGLLTNYEGNRILVADTGRRTVFDITKGGDVTEAPNRKFFCDVPGPYGLISFADKVFCTFSGGRNGGLVYMENGLVCMEEGASFSEERIRVRGFPNGLRETPYFDSEAGNREGDCGCWTALGYHGKMLYLHSGLGCVFIIDDHDVYSPKMPILASGLQKPLGMITHPVNGHLYVAERAGGAVKAVPHDADGIDMRYVPAVACGFKEPSCARFSPDGKFMFVCDMSGCCIWRVEL